MTHSYAVTGMTCNGCVATVKQKLMSLPEITSAEVTLDGNATIVMKRHIGVNLLQDAIGQNSHYRIRESGATMSIVEAPEEKRSWFATYLPLLIIAAYITGVSALLSQGSLHQGMVYFMAGFFLVFSFFKLLDLKGFATSYAMYDLLAMKLPFYGFVYPFIELALGIAYVTQFNPLITNWATLIVMGFSSLGVIRSVMGNQKIRCACLGAVFNLPMSTVTIVEDLLMVIMAGYMLAGY